LRSSDAPNKEGMRAERGRAIAESQRPQGTLNELAILMVVEDRPRKIASSEVVVSPKIPKGEGYVSRSRQIPNRAVVAHRWAKRWARMCPRSVGCIFGNAQVLTCNEVKALTVPTTGRGRSRMLAELPCGLLGSFAVNFWNPSSQSRGTHTMSNWDRRGKAFSAKDAAALLDREGGRRGLGAHQRDAALERTGTRGR
jgi:hypothetical protein